jgi:hypothetical protein
MGHLSRNWIIPSGDWSVASLQKFTQMNQAVVNYKLNGFVELQWQHQRGDEIHHRS